MTPPPPPFSPQNYLSRLPRDGARAKDDLGEKGGGGGVVWVARNYVSTVHSALSGVFHFLLFLSFLSSFLLFFLVIFFFFSLVVARSCLLVCFDLKLPMLFADWMRSGSAKK